MKLNKLFIKLFFTFLAITLAAPPLPSYAMSTEQKDLYLRGILYYDLACSEGASSDSTVSLDGETTGPPEEVQKIVWATLIDGGIDDMHAAAVMGNINHEGGWNPMRTEYAANIPNDESKDPHVVGSYGYGLIGWTPGTRLLDSMEEAGIEGKPYTAETQAAVILAHIEGKTPSQYTPDVGERFLATNNIEDATTAYQGTASTKGFENPADPVGSLPDRIKSAKKFLEKFGGTGASGASSSSELDLESIAKEYGLHSISVKKANGSDVKEHQANQAPDSVGSTIKLIIADAFLKTNPNLNKKVTIKNSHLYGGGTPTGTMWDPKAGQEVTLGQALRYTLEKSSNTLANVLIDEAGGPGKITQVANNNGYKSTKITQYFKNNPTNPGSPRKSTANDLSKAMSRIFASKSPSYRVAQEALRNSSYTFGLNSEANKWGGTDSFTGNSGLFDVNGEKYIITVMSEKKWQDEVPGIPATSGTQPSQSVSDIKEATNEILSALKGESEEAGEGCACSENSDISVEGKNDAVKVFNVLSQVSDLNPAAISGIIGNLMRETGGDTYDFDPDSSGAFEGIIQWDSGRWSGLESWATGKGKDPRKLETQAEYIWVEMTSGGYGMPETLSRLKEAEETPEGAKKAAADFDEWFERSSHGRTERMENAARFFEEFVEGGGLTGGTADSNGNCSGGSGTSTGQLDWPDDGRKDPISSCFGPRSSPGGIGSTNHQGLDIASAGGENTTAADGGEVTQAGGDTNNTIEIDHGNNMKTRYLHSSSVEVRVGQKVDKGDVIGKVGTVGQSTGDHIHFEVIENEEAKNALNFLAEDGRDLGGCSPD